MKRFRKLGWWLSRLALGAALGVGLHVAWERHASVRVATGLAAKALASAMPGSSDPLPTTAARPGQFSLDAIAASADPAAEMAKWRQHLSDLTPERRTEMLGAGIHVTSAGLRSFLTQLTTNDALRAEVSEWMRLISDVMARDGEALTARALTSLAHVDLPLALDAAQASGSSAGLHAVLMIMAEQDPAAARQAVATGNMDRDADLERFTTLVEVLRDPDTTLDRLSRAGSAADLQLTLLAVANAPVASVLVACRDEKTGALDADAISEVLNRRNLGDHAEFLQALAAAGPDGALIASQLKEEAAPREAARDPGAALSFLKQTAESGQWPLSDEVGRLAASAAMIDPHGALALAAQNPSEAARREAERAVFESWLRRDPTAALAALESTPDLLQGRLSKISGDDVVAAVQQTQHSFAEGAETLAALPSGAQKSSLLARHAEAWARIDAPAAFAWAKTTGGDGTTKSILLQWARTDPNAALEAARTESPATRAILAMEADLPTSRRLELLRGLPGGALQTDVANCVRLAGVTPAQVPTLVEILDRLTPEQRGSALVQITDFQIRNGRTAVTEELLEHIEIPSTRFNFERALYEARTSDGLPAAKR